MKKKEEESQSGESSTDRPYTVCTIVNPVNTNSPRTNELCRC
jgi:hypothetical protein